MLKWIGMGLAAVGVAAGAGLAYAGSAAEERLGTTYEAEARDIAIPFPLTAEERAALAPAAAEGEPDGGAAMEETATEPQLDEAALAATAQERAVARGEALVKGRLGCGDCHGADGAGKLIVDAQPMWTWYAPNITRGGVTRDYTGREWDLILRHGIKPDGTPATMPAEDFKGLSDQEVSDVAAYYNSLPASDKVQPHTELGPIGKVMIGFGKLPLAAEGIDHKAPHKALPPPPAVDLTYGAHVASGCVGCHREDYSGGPIAQGPPDWPIASNLTPHPDGLAGWSEDDFVRLMREGKRPDGSMIQQPMLGVTKLQLSDTELRAMALYFLQLPERPTGK